MKVEARPGGTGGTGGPVAVNTYTGYSGTLLIGGVTIERLTCDADVINVWDGIDPRVALEV